MMSHNMMEESPTMIDRKIYFAPKVEIMPIESRLSFSKEEIQQAWYSAAEMETMLNRCSRDADQLESSSRGDDKAKRPLSSRGLEGFTTEGAEIVSDAFHACIDAVMDEQEEQWTNDTDDHDRLAIASQQVSCYSTDIAIKRATKDEKDARKIYKLDAQKLSSPPSLPKRKLSAQDISLLVQKANDFVVANCSQKDNMLVDLDNCGRIKDNRGPRHNIVPIAHPMISTSRAKAA